MLTQNLSNYATDPFEFVLDRYREGYRIVVLGENHGSPERHEFFSRLVQLVKSEYSKLKLGLELDVKWKRRVNEFILTGGTSSDKFFEAGYRRGTGYRKILAAAAESGVPVICLDSGGEIEERDKLMASRAYEGIYGDDSVLIYVGEFHAMKLRGNLGGNLKNTYGPDKVFVIGQEVEDEVRTRGSFTQGFTAEIERSVLKSKSMSFDLRDAGLRRILAQIDEGHPPGFAKRIWYDKYDGFIYLAKNLRDL